MRRPASPRMPEEEERGEPLSGSQPLPTSWLSTTPLPPLGIPTPDTATLEDAPQRRGPGPPLHPLPFNPRTAAARSCAAGPAGLGDLQPQHPKPTQMVGG